MSDGFVFQLHQFRKNVFVAWNGAHPMTHCCIHDSSPGRYPSPGRSHFFLCWHACRFACVRMLCKVSIQSRYLQRGHQKSPLYVWHSWFTRMGVVKSHLQAINQFLLSLFDRQIRSQSKSALFSLKLVSWFCASIFLNLRHVTFLNFTLHLYTQLTSLIGLVLMMSWNNPFICCNKDELSWRYLPVLKIDMFNEDSESSTCCSWLSGARQFLSNTKTAASFQLLTSPCGGHFIHLGANTSISQLEEEQGEKCWDLLTLRESLETRSSNRSTAYGFSFFLLLYMLVMIGWLVVTLEVAYPQRSNLPLPQVIDFPNLKKQDLREMWGYTFWRAAYLCMRGLSQMGFLRVALRCFGVAFVGTVAVLIDPRLSHQIFPISQQPGQAQNSQLGWCTSWLDASSLFESSCCLFVEE